ncbi:MAG: restriction endonuclease [Spirochaetia bacterium]|nr:restriction endonuclease [Spirochaetia bacterium]
MGFIALGQKEFSIAKEFLKKSMHLKIEEAKYQLAFMTALFESGETEKAFDIIKNLLEEDPENFDFNLYFIIMSQKENFEEGKEKIEKFIFKTESESVITLLYRFYVYICYHNKSIEDIASFFKKLLTEKKLSEKSKIEISYYRMLSLIKSIIFEEARKIYQEIKNINSSYKDIEALGKFTGFDSEFGLPQEIEKNMNDLFEETVARLLPDNLLFHILGLKTKETIDCAKYFNKTDFKITLKEEYAPLSIDRLFIQYADLPSSKYVRFCEKVIGFHDYLIAKKMKSAEGDGFDFIVKKKTDPDYRVLFAFRRWSDDARISDIFLNNLMNKVNENKTKGAVLISNGSLTDEALKKSSLLKKIKVPDEVELKKIFQINLNNL